MLSAYFVGSTRFQYSAKGYSYVTASTIDGAHLAVHATYALVI